MPAGPGTIWHRSAHPDSGERCASATVDRSISSAIRAGTQLAPLGRGFRVFTLQGWSRRRYEGEGVNETVSSDTLAEQPDGPTRHRAAALIVRLRARISPLSVIAGVAWLLGIVCRAEYALHAHAPRHYVTSDVMPITVLAETLVDPSAHQRFLHTIWPPGMPAFLALNLLFDPTLGTAAACQLVMSCLVPLMVAHCAYVVFGRRAGWLALAFASLHFGFIHYVGFY